MLAIALAYPEHETDPSGYKLFKLAVEQFNRLSAPTELIQFVESRMPPVPENPWKLSYQICNAWKISSQTLLTKLSELERKPYSINHTVFAKVWQSAAPLASAQSRVDTNVKQTTRENNATMATAENMEKP